ncbi:hypothetical protein GGI12_000280 [Dipsacomyces acuminosporus]|nr:hypothetical protein GGI12_000280 [Dipsacomyces acuminosporus]
MPSTGEPYFARELEKCEEQLAAGFAEPLDLEQVRRLVNIEHLLSDYDKQAGAPGESRYKSRIDSIRRDAQPWIETRNALIRSLSARDKQEPASSNGDAAPLHLNKDEESGEASAQTAQSGTAAIIDAASDARYTESAPAVQKPVEARPAHARPASTAQDNDSNNDKGKGKDKDKHKPVEKGRSGFAEKRQEGRGVRHEAPMVVPDTVEGVERLLKSQRAVQEDLTAELVSMASVLKKNSLAFGDIIEKDKAVVEEAAEALSRNLTNMDKQGARLSKYRKRAWGTTGMTWLAVLVVVCVFFMLVLLMRVVPKRH